MQSGEHSMRRFHQYCIKNIDFLDISFLIINMDFKRPIKSQHSAT